MDITRDGMQPNPPSENNSHGAMTMASNGNLTIESLLRGSLAVLNRTGHPFGVNPNVVDTSLLEYASAKRRQQINPSLLVHSFSVKSSDRIMGTSQPNHAPLFPTADLVRIAALLQASSDHQSSSPVPGPALANVSGQDISSQNGVASIVAGFQSNGGARRLDTKQAVALLRDLTNPTLGPRIGLLPDGSEYALTSKQPHDIGRGETRFEYAPNAGKAQVAGVSTTTGLAALRVAYGQSTHNSLGAAMDSAVGATSSFHELDTSRIDIETASAKTERTTAGTFGIAIPDSSQKSKKRKQKDDQPFATLASTKSDTKVPDKNGEPTNPFLLPCRARGMPTDHNFRNAHFVIPGNVRHGEELICSYQACRNAGIKFQYCASCRIPVAKRNFNQRHSHGLSDAVVHSAGTTLNKDTLPAIPAFVASSVVGDHKPPVSPHDLYAREKGTSARTVVRHCEQGELAEGIATQDRRCLDVMVTSLPPPNELHRRDDGVGGAVEALTTGVHTKGQQQTTVTTSTKDSGGDRKKRMPPLEVLKSRPQLLEAIPDISIDRELRWASLLRSRPSIDDSDLLSTWLMEVMAVSDLRRPLPQTLPAVSNSASSSVGDGTGTDEGDDLSCPSSGGATSACPGGSGRD